MRAGSAIGRRRAVLVTALAGGIVATLLACSSSTPSESPTTPTTEHDMTNMAPGTTMAGGY
jgi:hypothetical protein